MDIQMPKLDGNEATKRIREIEKEKGGHIPIIAMTACSDQNDIDGYLLTGMDGFLAKPINRVELYRLLKKYCNPAQFDEEDALGK